MRFPLTGWLRRFFPEKPLGRRGEEAAERYLKRRGYKVLARGNRLRPGELDLVMLDGRTIVFVEVKTRRSQEARPSCRGGGREKQRRLTRLAVTFLKRHKLLEYPGRFDVVAITWPAGSRRPQIEHFINAFEAVGKWGFYS